jgi:xylulokinase
LILTIDLGTTRTKAAVWGSTGPVAAAHAELTTRYPAPGWAEQDPQQWWTSVVAACAGLDPACRAAVEAIGFSGARQTIALVDAGGLALGPALLWSDRRAAGAVAGLDAGAVAAKLAWLETHEPARLAAARWALAPRDLVVGRLTGEAVTDETLASATGLPPGHPLLPPAVAPATVVGRAGEGPAAELGVRSGVPVVIGAGDRQCEVLATAARPDRPMVSWGTTANVSIPVTAPPDPVPAGLLLTRAAGAGWLLEGGLAAAGSLLEWLAGLTGVAVDDLVAQAAAGEPGAAGVVAVPWLGGARAPWWRADAGAAFLGFGPSHGPGDLARAAIEGVAWDVVRCIEAAGEEPSGLALAAGAGIGPWVAVLTAAAGLPAVRRACADAASAGAALIVSDAVGAGLERDAINPVVETVVAPDERVDRYRALRAVSDAATRAALDVVASLPGEPRFTVSG